MRTDPLDLRLLRYFVQTAEHLSFTAGARDCGVSQSALSQGIRQLEERLGLPLFDRGDRRVALTAAGEELLGRARKLLTDGRDAEEAMRGFSGATAGLLRVGVVQTVNALLIPEVIGQLARQHKGARFDVRELPAAAIEEAVADGALELGVSFHPVARTSLHIEPQGEERLLFIQADGRKKLPRATIRPADLAQTPMALLHRGFCTRALIDDAFAKAGCPIEPQLEMNSIAGLLAVVASGGFATILPELSLRMASSSPLAGCAIEGLALRRRLIILRRQNGYQSPLAQSFAAAIRALLGRGDGLERTGSPRPFTPSPRPHAGR